MDERRSLSRRKLLHTLAGTGVIAAADLAWWDAPYIGPRKACGAEPVRFQWSVPEPTRIALINSLVERFNQSQKDFAVQVEYVPQAQARQKLISAVTGGSPPVDPPGIHDHDPVGQGHRLDLVVGHVNRRRRDLLMHLFDLGAHLHPQFGVEIGQRLVEQEDLGVAHDRPAHRHALTLPAGKRLWPAIEQRGDVEDARRVPRPAP